MSFELDLVPIFDVVVFAHPLVFLVYIFDVDIALRVVKPMMFLVLVVE